MVSTVNHSKCKECMKILDVSMLTHRDGDFGLVCIDEEKCKAEKLQNELEKNNDDE